MREEIFNMTQKEITRLRVINQTIDKVITIREAAELGCLTLIKNKKPPKALMGLFFLSNLPNISCGMLRDVLLYK